MPLMVFLFAALVIASIPLFVFGARGVRVELPARQRRVVRANLGVSPTPGTQAPTMRQVVLQQGASTRVVEPVMAWAARTARRLTPARFLEDIDRRRHLAGVESWGVDQILAAKVLLGAVAACFAVLCFTANPSPAMFFVAVVLVAGGFYAPELILNARGRKRQDEIERAFPGVLDQLTVCVEAGLGLDAAIARAAESGTGPIAEELTRVLQDIQLGVSRQTALESLVARTDVADVRHFVVALGQANRYGVPVADTLRTQALEARARRRARAEQRAQKMSVKLLFPLIFCILPALFIVILGPAAIRISHIGFGH